MIKLFHGDCLDILKTLSSNSVDTLITDPPYGLSDQKTSDIIECMTAWLADKPYDHNKKGFMNHSWDGWVPGPEVWKECFRILKPGSHALIFASTRTMDLMSMAIRLSGFEIRDQLCWLNSQGMPHGMDISKAIEKSGKKSSEWEGWNTTLKPAMELILLARKPLDGTIVENILTHGVGGLNIDECRIPVDLSIDDPRLGGEGSWSTDGMARNVYGKFDGTSGFRVKSSELGRYPTGVIWDGSDDVKEVFDSFGEKSSGVPGKRQKNHETKSMSGTLGMLDREEVGYADKGGVHRFFKECQFSDEDRRFFYCGKVKSEKERQGSKHPTIKPLELMKYLVKLTNPKNGIVLDPFAGTGTTGEAVALNGGNAILIERELEYYEHCKNRLNLFLE